MCAICKAIDFKNNPVNQVALQAMTINGVQCEGDFTEDFTLCAVYREGIQLGIGTKVEPLCDNHKNLVTMIGMIQGS